MGFDSIGSPCIYVKQIKDVISPKDKLIGKEILSCLAL